MSRGKTAVCVKCGREWQVGNREMPFYGYICPRCSRRRRLRSILMWTGITAFSVILFAIARRQANAWRGYSAIGGEALLLGLPVYIYAIGQTVRDWARAVKEVLRDEGRV